MTWTEMLSESAKERGLDLDAMVALIPAGDMAKEQDHAELVAFLRAMRPVTSPGRSCLWMAGRVYSIHWWQCGLRSACSRCKADRNRTKGQEHRRRTRSPAVLKKGMPSRPAFQSRAQ